MKAQTFEIFDKQGYSYFPKSKENFEKPGKVLIIDLAKEIAFEEEIDSKIFKTYVGGRAFALRLFAKYAESKDPRENPIVMAPGALCGSKLPDSNFFNIVFQSPLTKKAIAIISNCGFGLKIKHIGYDALILQGALRKIGIVEVKDNVSFSFTERLFGMNSQEVESFIKKTNDDKILLTGKAADNLIPYASVISEGMSIGRSGLGCLFGYKNLKGISISSFGKTIPVFDLDKEQEARDKFLDLADKSRYYQEFKENGTLSQFEFANNRGSLPVDNFSLRFDPRVFYYRPEIVKDELGDQVGKYLPQGYKIFSMLGTNLGIFDCKKVIHFYELCITYGMDPVSVGNILGWAFQADERGLLGKYKIQKDEAGICKLIQEMGTGTKFGAIAAKGIKAASKSVGDSINGKEINGLEVGLFDYRGFPTQAITDYQQLNVYQFSEFIKAKKVKNFWICYQEDIALGMDCLGLSQFFIPTFFYEKSFFKKSILKCLPHFGTKVMNSYTIAYYYQAFTGISVNPDFTEHMGNLCYQLQEAINKKLAPEKEIGFASYFTLEPKSNYSDEKVVNFVKLYYSYKSCREKIKL